MTPFPIRRAMAAGSLAIYDQGPYHYDLGVLEWIANQVGLNARYIGDWNHPLDQRMMLFTR